MKGIVISGTGSGVGKTSVASGLMLSLSRRYKVQPFKVGPDFIDPMYHSAATGRKGRNLDSFLMGDDAIRKNVGYGSKGADLCIVEGVRGLHEGFAGDDEIGSTAHISKILGFPVVLVVDVRSLNRSVAAVINGFRSFDPDVRIEGVILNNVSGKQHSDKLDTVMDTYCKDVKILGKILKDPTNTLEQRYLGLRVMGKFGKVERTVLESMADNVDRDMLMGIAEDASADLPDDVPYVERSSGLTAAVPVDDAYSFYYSENIECLEASGIQVKRFSPVAGDDLPDADIAYLGGGYPELYAKEISDNENFLQGLKNMSDDGCPVLGECGGMMTMCRSMKTKEGVVHRAVGIFDAEADMVGKRHGPTYMMASATQDNPLFKGFVKGHEYHYSEVSVTGGRFCFDIVRGAGILGGKDGLFAKNSVGTYMHQHCMSCGDWARGLAEAVERRRD